jgi:hypothetical protein
MFIARYLVGVQKRRKARPRWEKTEREGDVVDDDDDDDDDVVDDGSDAIGQERGKKQSKEKGEKEEDQENTKRLRTQPKPISTSAQLPLQLYLLYLLNPPRPPLEPPHPRPLLQQHHRDPPHKERARRTQLIPPSSKSFHR